MNTSLHVLLIENKKERAQWILHMLASSQNPAFHANWVETLQEGREHLSQNPCQAVLLNAALTKHDEWRAWLEHPMGNQTVSHLALADSGEQHLAQVALERGAHDCLLIDQLSLFSLTHALLKAIEHRSLKNQLNEKQYELEQTQKRLATISEKNADGLLIVDQEGVIQYINQAAIKLFNRPHETLLQTNFGYPIQGKDFAEIEIFRSDGSHVPIEMRVSEISWGEKNCFLASLRDISERKKAQEAIAYNEFIYRKAIQVANAIPYYQNYTTNTYEFVGDNVTKILGYSPKELTPDLFYSLVSEIHLLDELEDLSLDEAIRKARQEGVIWKSETRVRTKTGEERWIYNTAIQLYDENNAVTGSLGILHDITEQKHLQEQFLQAQKMEAIGRLAGGVAHDFNNLLMVIRSYSDFGLREVSPGSSLEKDLRQIQTAANRAANLTRQLLTFSRRSVIQPKTMNLNEIIQNLEKMLGRLIGEDIQIHYHLESTLGSIKADPGHIEQIIMNLSVNARDAMPHGGTITLETKNVVIDANYVKTHPNSHAGNYAMLAVSDTGGGIDNNTLQHVFEPFFTTKTQGTGLGLATVYGIVQQNKGWVNVNSEPNTGTTFKIYFPRVEPLAETHPPKQDEPERFHGRESIMVVEDEEFVLNIICRVLKQNGYKTLVAHNGEEAVQLFLNHSDPIHLLITDVVMPKMNGKALVEILQSHYPQLKVIFMSGYTDSIITEQGIAQAGFKFIQKPFEAAELLQKVREMLDESHPAAT